MNLFASSPPQKFQLQIKKVLQKGQGLGFLKQVFYRAGRSRKELPSGKILWNEYMTWYDKKNLFRGKPTIS